MKLAFTVLAAGLAVTEGDQVVQQRPTFRKPFPDPALFRRSRRLAQEGGKPERLRFEVEDGGYQFNYEFAGASKVEHVFNLDSEGVHGIRCTAGRENHLEIFWANLTAAAAAALRKDAVISGSPEWQCSFSIPAKSRNSRIQSSGPLLRVMEVEALATSRSLCTRLRVVPTSPVEIFRDLYIDLSWHPVGRSADRRLQACSTDHHYSLNYDCESQRASQSHVVGPFTCSNCYALLDITPDFRPTVSANPRGSPCSCPANLELGLNGPQSVSSNWTQLFSQRTGNLLNTIGFVMPMFGTLVSAINSWTVNMGIFANYELKGQADVRSILQGVLQTKRVYEWTGAEVRDSYKMEFIWLVSLLTSIVHYGKQFFTTVRAHRQWGEYLSASRGRLDKFRGLLLHLRHRFQLRQHVHTGPERLLGRPGSGPGSLRLPGSELRSGNHVFSLRLLRPQLSLACRLRDIVPSWARRRRGCI